MPRLRFFRDESELSLRYRPDIEEPSAKAYLGDFLEPPPIHTGSNYEPGPWAVFCIVEETIPTLKNHSFALLSLRCFRVYDTVIRKAYCRQVADY